MGKYEVLCHNSIKIKGNKIIYIDPYKISENYNDADYIFCTHSHYDHFSEEDTKKVIKKETKIITVKSSEEDAKKIVEEQNLLIVEPNKSYKIDDIEFKTTYAYNKNKKFHPKENMWVGFIIDFEGIKLNNKTKLYNRYVAFYLSKVDALYKAILKNYSVKLSDNLSSKTISRDEVYKKIFKTLEEYIDEIMPLKVEYDKVKCEEVLEEYDKLEGFSVGKLDEINHMEKNMMLLGISRKLFTHSLPLIVAEQCYIDLLKKTRELIVNAKSNDKKEEAYELLIKLIEDYNIKLLSTKIYWEKPQERADYKIFWDKYKNVKDYKEKEILFIKEDLKRLNRSKKDYKNIIKLHKQKLVELGEMRQIKDKCKTITGRFVKKCVSC